MSRTDSSGQTQHPEPAEVVGLTEGEREAIRTLFPTPGFYNDTVALVGRILADRLAAVQAERDRLRRLVDAYETSGLLLRARAESAEAERDTARREADDLRARLGAVIPSECWVTRSDVGLDCTAMIGGGFENGAKFTEEMCCLPCRLRAALANPSATEDEEGAQAATQPAGRPLGVDVDPSSTDGITGRNGTIQGDQR